MQSIQVRNIHTVVSKYFQHALCDPLRLAFPDQIYLSTQLVKLLHQFPICFHMHSKSYILLLYRSENTVSVIARHPI